MKKARYRMIEDWMDDNDIELDEVLTVVALSNSLVGVGFISLGDAIKNKCYEMARIRPVIEKDEAKERQRPPVSDTHNNEGE